ncbi:MAG: hypothetical protein IKS35_06515, partial [Clostridia bacterium]|nr:hypothetical protein [Clostridia bacterium]
MKRRLESILLCIAMLMTLVPVMRVHADNENASNLYIAGNESQFEYYGDVDDPMYRYVLYNGGSTVLNDANPRVYKDYGSARESVNDGHAEFTRVANSSSFSVLALDEYEANGGAGYLNDNKLYGLFYDGNLEIDVRGYCSLNHYVTVNTAYDNIYGIYVTGNLTITGTGTGNNTLDVKMCLHADGTDTTAEKQSIAIYCGGCLTIGQNVEVNAIAGTVTGTNGAKSFGIYAGNGYEQTNAIVCAKGGNLTHTPHVNSDWSAGIHDAAAFSINGGSLDVSAGEGYESHGLRTSACTITSATVRATAGDTHFSYGIESTGTFYVTNADVIARGGDGDNTTGIGVNSTNTLAASLVVYSGTVTAESGIGSIRSKGISTALDGSVTVESGIVSASSGGITRNDAQSSNCGIATHVLNILGGRTEAVSSSAVDASGQALYPSNGVSLYNGDISVFGGKLTVKGMSDAISADGIHAPIIEGSSTYSEENLELKENYISGWRCAVLDASRVIVQLPGWEYGQTPNNPSVYHLDQYGNGVTASFEYRAQGTADFSATKPVTAGTHAVRATISSGQSGTT